MFKKPSGSALILLSLVSSNVFALSLSNEPLFAQTTALPNIMLMLDNSGSMSNIVPEAPYDADTTYLSSCPSANILSGGVASPAFPNDSDTFDVAIETDGSVNIYDGSNYITYGTGTGEKCFDPVLRYNARLYANSSGTSSCGSASCYTPSDYLDAVYTGNYLNWYFGLATGYTSVANFGSGAIKKPDTSTRMEVAQTAANSFTDQLPAGGVRIGLSTYNGDDGGSLLELIESLDSSKRSAVKSEIDSLSPSGSTPLAESLSDIGRYFAEGYSGDLQLHPDTASPSTASVANVFNSHNISNDSGQTISSPIQYACQKSFAVLMSDGRPKDDQNISTLLQDYDADCSGANAGSCGSFDQKNDRTYEADGSDYLDDVAQALFEIDLRPDLTKTGDQKNNVITYTIGFADEQVINDPLMQDTAAQGGWLFLTAENTDELTTALQNAFTDIIDKTSSASSAASNSTSLITGAQVFQARLNSADWSGQLLALDIDLQGDISTTPDWDAADVIDSQASSSRKIITISRDTKDGIPFTWSDISGLTDTTQEDDLNNDSSGSPDGLGSNRVDFLRGDDVSGFRTRSSKLGDIVHSSPFYVGAPKAGYLDSTYGTFASSYASRAPIIYVGANDGMLHGFDAATGQEKIAYVPGPVYPNLSRLTDSDYGDSSLPHRYFVDGSPMMADVELSSNWKTVLAGGLNAGGQGYYAIDITNPTNFSQSNAASLLLWEFTDEDDVDLGYTYNQPPLSPLTNQSAQIAKMNNGKWAVIVGNGYNNIESDGNPSTTGHAVLFVLFVQEGSDGTWSSGDYVKIDTGIGSTSTANGLATPMPVDTDGDGDIDIAYAGDLEGNLWKFDLTDSSSSNWSVAKLFTAKDSSNTVQPITTAPMVVPHTDGGYMVGFGTGRYLESADLNTTSTQTLYGIWDNYSGGGVSTISGARSTKLAEQTVIDVVTVSGVDYRLSSNNSVDYSTKRGWFMDLPTSGERVAFNPIARDQRFVFVTLIPDSSDPCASGGSGWLMELDYLGGSRLGFPPFDVTGDKTINDSDKIAYDEDGDGDDEYLPPTGKKFDGIPATPAVVDKDEETEVKIISQSTGTVETLTESKSKGSSGRLSWWQIFGD